tara:strand:+ start:56937 stop:58217 length:1281 start_codon:yes stop_codon:yes gene_type:complete
VKKFLLVLLFIFLLLLSLPIVGWWMSLQAQPSVSFTADDGAAQELGRIHQFIQQSETTPTHKRVEFSGQDLNQLIRHSSQQFKKHLDFAGHVNLQPERSELLLSINTHLPLRPYLNLRIDFTTYGKNLVLLGGQIGSINLPQQSVELLVNMTMPYAQQHPQYNSGTQLWQTIEAITLSENHIAIDFNIDERMQAQLQHQQLELFIGKTALERLPFYQQAIEQQFANRLGQRIKLYEVMHALFNLALSQPQADIVADNKAILLALFLHTADREDFEMLNLQQHVQLPQQPIELTIERRKDLATHFLSTAVITLFANSSIADAIGLYKELQDQDGYSGFSVSDLIADRAGSLFASQLINPNLAPQLQKNIALSQQEHDFFPITYPLASQLEQQLHNSAGNQQAMLEQIEQQIDQHARAVAIYQTAQQP